MKIKNQIIGLFLLFVLQLTNTYGAVQFGNPNGSNTSSSSAPVVIANDQASINTVAPLLVSPQTAFNYTGTGATGAVQVTPGAWYSLCIQIPTITGATYTLASATTSVGSATITMASTTGAQIGQQVTGTGVPVGAFIVSLVTNTSITLNVPCTAAGTVTLTNTAGQFVATWQSSPDNSSWSSINVLPKTINLLPSLPHSFKLLGNSFS